MAKATVSELIEQIGVAVMAAHKVAGDGVYDLHIFLQTYPTQQGPDYYTVHCDQSYIPYDEREAHQAAEEALRAELPNAVFDLSYDEDLYDSADAAFSAEMETAVW
jgi:hypothetical protein